MPTGLAIVVALFGHANALCCSVPCARLAHRLPARSSSVRLVTWKEDFNYWQGTIRTELPLQPSSSVGLSWRFHSIVAMIVQSIVRVFVREPKRWPLRGGQNRWHQYAGPWPRAPPRELWVPPPGWQAPSPPKKVLDPVTATKATPQSSAASSVDVATLFTEGLLKIAAEAYRVVLGVVGTGTLLYGVAAPLAAEAVQAAIQARTRNLESTEESQGATTAAEWREQLVAAWREARVEVAGETVPPNGGLVSWYDSGLRLDAEFDTTETQEVEEVAEEPQPTTVAPALKAPRDVVGVVVPTRGISVESIGTDETVPAAPKGFEWGFEG